MKQRFLFSLLLIWAMAGIGWLAGVLDLHWIVGIPVVGLILWKESRRILTAMEFSVTLIGTLAFLTVVGTLFYGVPFFWQFWFATLLGLMGISSFLCLVEQLPKMRRIGYILIHASIIIVIAGATLRSYQKEEGMVHLLVGQTNDRMMVMEGGAQVDRKVRLPFTVRLDAFQVEFYEMLYVFLRGEQVPVAKLSVERSHEVDVAGSHVKAVGTRVEEVPGRPGHPPWQRHIITVDVDGELGEIPQDVLVGNDKFALLYKTDRGEVKLYQSKVTLLDDQGNELVTQDVLVNHPLIHDGWWLYQSNWDRDDLRYSGLHAVRDPGLPFTLCGLVLLVLGVLLKIRLPRRRKEGAG
ncbi:MAG: cytochrome c biogenesis protein ResB [Pseudomonadota bacterium]